MMSLRHILQYLTLAHFVTRNQEGPDFVAFKFSVILQPFDYDEDDNGITQSWGFRV